MQVYQRLPFLLLLASWLLVGVAAKRLFPQALGGWPREQGQDTASVNHKKLWILCSGLKADGKAVVANGMNHFHRHTCKQWVTKWHYPQAAARRWAPTIWINLADLLFSSFLHVHLVRKMDAPGNHRESVELPYQVPPAFVSSSWGWAAASSKTSQVACRLGASLCLFGENGSAKKNQGKDNASFARRMCVWDGKGQNNTKYYTHLTWRHHSQYD